MQIDLRESATNKMHTNRAMFLQAERFRCLFFVCACNPLWLCVGVPFFDDY
jgi:hypothetical protein